MGAGNETRRVESEGRELTGGKVGFRAADKGAIRAAIAGWMLQITESLGTLGGRGEDRALMLRGVYRRFRGCSKGEGF